jgi:transposase
VYEVHEWAKVRELYREGASKKAIARRLGMSRNTVARLLASEEPPRYEREPAGSQLDPFKGAVLEMLREDASVPATVIREHLQRRGYGGGITILKDYLAGVRPQFKDAPDFGRTSYVPGEILQADWWDTGVDVPVGKGASRRAHGFVATLPFSDAHAVVFTHAQTTADAVPALWGCLTRLGGVPGKLVVDNDTSLVVCRGRARPRPVDELAALLGALSMGYVVLPPRRPQSKGAVERSNGYLETSFLPLRRFSGLADLQAQSDAWAAEVAWPRHHRRLGARVIEALTVERAELAALPDPAPGVDRHLEVRVSRDGFCRVAGVDYSLPPGYGGRRVAVRLSLHDVGLFCEGRRIAAHARSYVPCDVIRDPAHMQALAAAQEAHRRLKGGEPELPAVDLARYDALVGAPL